MIKFEELYNASAEWRGEDYITVIDRDTCEFNHAQCKELLDIYGNRSVISFSRTAIILLGE